MTKIDTALETFRQDMDDPKNQSQFYDLFLNSNFLVPTNERDPDGPEDQVLPLVLEAEGNDYLVLFDTEQRLTDWAGGEVDFVEVPGHVLAEISTPPLRWALNVGTEHTKEFLPEEITWLRQAVDSCKADADTNAG